MRQISVKSGKGVNLKGVSVELVIRDGNIIEVRFADSDGGSCVVATGPYGHDLRVLVPEPVKLVKKVRLYGTALGLQIDETHADQGEADARLQQLREAIITDDADVSVVTYDVEVPEDEVPF